MQPSTPTTDSTVHVTGGSRGIGAATAWLCAQRGHAIAVKCARDAAAAERVVGHIREAGGRAIAVQADVVKNRVLAMYARIHAELPPTTAWLELDRIIRRVDGRTADAQAEEEVDVSTPGAECRLVLSRSNPQRST